MIKIITFLICLTILTSGCSYYRVNSQDTSDEIYLPKKSTREVVYVEEVTKPHEVIGTVTVAADRSKQRMSTIIERMKYEAAVLGGDAITDIKMESHRIWKELPAQELIGNAYIRANFTASVIAYKE